MHNLKNLPIEAIIPGGRLYDEFQPKCCKSVQSWNGAFFCIYDDALCVLSFDGKFVCISKFSELQGLDGLLSTISAKSSFHVMPEEYGCVWFVVDDYMVVLNVVDKCVVSSFSLPPNSADFDYCPVAGMWAYTSGNSLWLLSRHSGNSSLVYKADGDETVAKAAARDELGISKGTFWSPDGRKLAFYVIDQSQVTSYPLVHIADPIASVRNIKYPMTGCPSESAKVLVYDLSEANSIHLADSYAPFDYTCCITFPSDSSVLYAVRENRQQNHLDFNCYNANNGNIMSTLLSESDDKYVEPQFSPLFINDKDWFVWFSRRDGFFHAFLYEKSGHFVRQLSSGCFEIIDVLGFSPVSNSVIAIANFTSPISRNLISISIESGVRLLSDKEMSVTSACLSSCGGYCFFHSESATNPGHDGILSLADCCVAGVLVCSNPLEGYLVPRAEVSQISVDGAELYQRVVYPPNFDSNSSYPMVCYFYGGPHVQLIRDDWNNGTAGFEYMMALDGYLVYTIDPSGSDCRGRDFEQKIWRNISSTQCLEYFKAVSHFAESNPFVDVSRIGVYGWSFGGHISASLALRYPSVFRVAVAGGAVVDWRLYEVMYTERYMQTPQQNPDGYAATDLTSIVKNLKGRLLLIHCNEDPVVLWQNSLKLLKAAENDDVLVDYNVCVGYPHNVRGPHRVNLMRSVKRYFDDFLK